MSGLKLVIFAGLNASCKSTFAKSFAASHRNFVVIDKDDPALSANRAIQQRLQELGGTQNLYVMPEYRDHLRPAIYAEIFKRACGVLEQGQNCVVDAPCGEQAQDPDFYRNLSWRLQPFHAKPVFLWFVCTPEALERNMRQRNYARDLAKLASPDAWERYLGGVDFSFRPRFPHVEIDTTELSQADGHRAIERSLSF